MPESLPNQEPTPSIEAVAEALSQGKEQGTPPTENAAYINWVKLREAAADSDATGMERLKLSLDTVEVLYKGGYVEEAIETLTDVGSILGGHEDLHDRFRELQDLFFEDK